MRWFHGLVASVVICLGAVPLAPLPSAQAQSRGTPITANTQTTVAAGKSGRVIPNIGSAMGVGIQPRELPLGRHPIGSAPTAAKDIVLQTMSTSQSGGTGPIGYQGIGASSNYAVRYIPPDTSGGAGDTQYVQTVNAAFAVFDKASGNFCSNSGCSTTPVFYTIQQLFQSAGNTTPCATRNDGDAVVVFDRMAHRWVLSQFAVPSGGPYYHCVAVSTSADATGTYAVYAFKLPYFPDYPKIGAWPEAYYATFNMFNMQRGGRFVGAELCAYERAAMLQGQPARTLCAGPNSSYGSVLPADLDGKAADLGAFGNATCTDSANSGPACPPVGTPNLLANFYSGYLQLGYVKANWSTMTMPGYWPSRLSGAAAFTPACNGGACIPQPAVSQQLDSLADRLMFRVAYSRPCLTYDSSGACTGFDNGHAVISHSVAVNPSVSTLTGIRWYDVTPFTLAGAFSPTINRQSTFSPDSDYRWMPSIAMDRAGNVAVGFSRSNGSAKYPSFSVAYAPGLKGTAMTVEQAVQSGAGSQTQYSRWGDYTQMSVDPVDGCTLWYTGQYLSQTGVFNWSTWIYPAPIQQVVAGATCQ